MARRFAFCLIFLAATVGLPPALHAEDRSARFVQLMSFLPPVAFANRSDALPAFYDMDAGKLVVEALIAAHPDKVQPGTIRAFPWTYFTLQDGADWARTSGFGFADMRAAAFVPDARDPALALLLAPQAAARVEPAFLGNGYALTQDNGFAALWRSQEGASRDDSLLNPDDPFAFPLTYPSRVAMRGEVLLHAQNWPGLTALHNAGQPAAAVTAFAQALDLPDWGAHHVVQATVFSDPAIFSVGFRVDANLQAQLQPDGAVPYWNNLMFADLSDGNTDLTLVILLYHAKTDAKAAASAMGPALTSAVLPAFDDRPLGDYIIGGRAVVAGTGPYMAIYALESAPSIDSPGAVYNNIYGMLRGASLGYELYPLGVQMP